MLTNVDWNVIEYDIKTTMHYLLMSDMDISTDCLFKSSVELAIVCNLYYLEKLCQANNIPFHISVECFLLKNIQPSNRNVEDIHGLQMLIRSFLDFVKNL